MRDDGSTVEARLDIVDPLGNTTYYVDVTIVDALSVDTALERQRSKRNGVAACVAEDKKLTKYPGPATVPLAINSYGRIGQAGMAWLRAAYSSHPGILQELLNELAALVQSHISIMVRGASAATTPGR